MSEKARDLAYEQIDNCSALSDTEYDELKNLPEEEVLEKLAMQFLQEAVNYNFGK